ncbi:6359_t:CDS:2, partial [Gigaspora rosea]
GTPPQTLKIAIGTTYNLLWIVSDLCMRPFGNASSGQTTNFYNTSLSNDSATDYEEFTIKYINGAELESIWAKSTVLINNQTSFEQMEIGLPIDIIGNKNITISNTSAGQLGLKTYQNSQTMGIALNMGTIGGAITLGGVDLSHIL